jgi:hypothetical protein
VSQAGDLVDADNRITKKASKMFLVSFLNAVAAWIDKTADE